MKTVLIVSWDFAPCSRMSAKRYGLMCKYFKENGYDSYVITAPPEVTGNGAKPELEIPLPNEHIIEIGFDKSNMYFISAVLYLFGKLKLYSRTVETSQYWYKNVKRAINLKQLKNIGFDVVIGTYGPMVNLYVAKYLAKKLRCKYIIDIRDLISDYNEKLPQGYRRTSIFDYVLEKISLYSASGIVTVNPKLTNDMCKRYPNKKIVTIYNGWDGELKNFPDNITEKYLYFAGILYEYMLDSLILLFRALKIVNEKENIKMIIRCVGFQAVNVKQIIRKMKLQEIVSCLPTVSEKVVREERQRAYINVVFNSIHKEDYESMVAIPGKTYEYMHENAPVLAVTLSRSRLAKVLQYTDKGIGTALESEIVDFILNAGGKFNGNDNVLKFSRKYQAARLCRFMDYVLEH